MKANDHWDVQKFWSIEIQSHMTASLVDICIDFWNILIKQQWFQDGADQEVVIIRFNLSPD